MSNSFKIYKILLLIYADLLLKNNGMPLSVVIEKINIPGFSVSQCAGFSKILCGFVDAF